MEINLNTLPKEIKNLPKKFITPYPPQYFKIPFTQGVVGIRGRGKTYNVCLWNQWMFENEYFTRFYVISPTYESNDPVQMIPTRPNDIYMDVQDTINALHDVERKVIQDVAWYKEITERYTKLYLLYIENDNDVSKLETEDVQYLREMQDVIERYYNNLNEMNEQMNLPCKAIEYTLNHRTFSPNKYIDTVLGDRYDDMHPWFHPPPKIKRPVPLLFIDDCSHTPIYSVSQNNPLVHLTLRHRHVGGKNFGMSIQFLVQTFLSGVPRGLRSNCVQMLLFKTHDSRTIEDIYKEVGAFIEKDEFIKMYENAVAEKHMFLLIDMESEDKKRLFRKGWDIILIPPTLIRERISKKRKNREEEEEKDGLVIKN